MVLFFFFCFRRYRVPARWRFSTMHFRKCWKSHDIPGAEKLVCASYALRIVGGWETQFLASQSSAGSAPHRVASHKRKRMNSAAISGLLMARVLVCVCVRTTVQCKHTGYLGRAVVCCVPCAAWRATVSMAMFKKCVPLVLCVESVG